MTPRPPVLAIVGLTGTGKTELACAVARAIGAEVISADSMQVYRGMDIGTAKPSRALRAEIPHHGIDLVDPDDPMSAGRFAGIARRVAREIHARGRPIVLCGGTGLYVRAFAGGLVPGIGSDPAIRRELERIPNGALHRELERADPEAAARIHPRDRVRSLRALEVLRVSGRPLSAQQAVHGFGDREFDVRLLGLTLAREALWRALRARTERMFATGLLDEVRELHARGYGPELRPLQSIGYRQAGQVLRGELAPPDAIEATYLATRRYARRQRTWFRAERGIEWVDAAETEKARERALALLGD